MTEDEKPDDVQSIRLVRSDHDKIIDITAVVLWAGLVYLWASPHSQDQIVNYVRTRYARWRHMVSIWQTQRSIETLPETDEPEL